MPIEQHKIDEHNHALLPEHRRKLEYITAGLPDAAAVLRKLIDFQVAGPSPCISPGISRPMPRE